MDKPSNSGNSGRTKTGQFKEGNQLGIGNRGPSSEKAKALKQALMDAVTEEDLKEVVKKMLLQAKEGDTSARRELFDRVWGKSKQEVDLGDNTIKSIMDIMAVIGIGKDG